MHHHDHDSCSCCGPHGSHGMPRRSFLAAVGGTTLGGAVLSGCATVNETKSAIAAGQRKPCLQKKALVVQPALSYRLFKRHEKTSWRPWGGLHNESDVEQEITRITRELQDLAATAEFPVEFRPVAKVTSPAQGAEAAKGDADVMLIYGATGDGGDIEAMIKPERHNLMFLRHDSGPVYLWYEIASPRLLRKTVDELGQPGLEPRDIVVDKYDELLWRLRALYALKNTVGSRIVVIGGPGGWGAGGQKAPEITKNIWKMDFVVEPYDDLSKRIAAARADAARVKKAEAEAAEYLKQPGLTLSTDKGFVDRAFLLHDVIRGLMDEAGAQAMTINECMSTIMPMSETTACLVLTLINDSGALAFCESDFVVIPSGVLLHHIAGTPVFLNDPTYPHDGMVTCAHCTAPRKMDGKHLEKVNILTHYESDYGAAPKVDMRIGQPITMIDPDFASKRWIGFTGKILANPFLDICRSQVDVSIEGDWERLDDIMHGFHWMMSYGDHRKELGYALHKVGIEWVDLSDIQTKKA